MTKNNYASDTERNFAAALERPFKSYASANLDQNKIDYDVSKSKHNHK